MSKARAKRTEEELAKAVRAAHPAAVSTVARRGARIEFDDGTSMPVASKPRRRRRESDDAVASRWQDTCDIVDSPRAYALAAMFAPGPLGGRPSTYPPELYSVMWSLIPVYQNQRALVRELKDSPHLYERIWNGVLANMPDTDETDMRERARVQAEIVDRGLFPNRTTLNRAFRKIDTDLANERLGVAALEIGVEYGYLDTGRQAGDAIPDRRDNCYGDATVHTGPSDVTEEEAFDPKTNKVWKRRVDHDAIEHTEGGGAAVRGMKSVQLMLRSDEYRSDLFLSIEVEKSPAPSHEADRAVAMMERLVPMVAEVATAERQTCGSHRLTHAFNAFLYDGAPDADHHRRLLDLGIPLANTTASKVAHLDPKSRNETRIEHIHDLGNWPHTHNPEDGSPSCTSRLVAIGGQVHLQETVNGEVEYTALEHKFKPVWRSGRRYLYIELNVPCRRRRTTGSIRMSLQRSTYAKNDASGNDRLHVYAAITRGIRVWPVGTEAGKKLKGDRVAIEAKHSVWDDAWPNRRIPAWSNHMRRVLLLGWAYGDNILTEARLARARAASEALERAG